MSKHADRIKQNLAGFISRAVFSQMEKSGTADERWYLVAEQIELLIDQIVMENIQRLADKSSAVLP